MCRNTLQFYLYTVAAIPQMNVLNAMHLGSSESAILSALIFNAMIIPFIIPIAFLRGVKLNRPRLHNCYAEICLDLRGGVAAIRCNQSD